MKSLMNATSWENSSGFGTISHFLTKKVLSGDWQSHISCSTVRTIQAAFASAYQMPEVTAQQIRQLFEFYQHPEDQQKLWVAPLQYILNQKTAAAKNLQPLKATDMAVLCEALDLHFQLVDYQSGAINPMCKGYEGKEPFAKITAVYDLGYWQPITQDMSEVHHHQLLWKQGFRHFTEHSMKGLCEAARKVLGTPPTNFTSPQLLKAIVEGNDEVVAKICLSQAHSIYPDNGFFRNIDHVLASKDIATLLTIFYFKPNTRNYILTQALSMHHAAFVNDFLKYFYLLPQGMTATDKWSVELEKVVPSIYSDVGDTLLLNAIRTKDDKTAKKLIEADSDIYQVNKRLVSPLHLACANENSALVSAMIERSAVQNSNRSIVVRALYQGLDLTKRDADGKTPLHYAAAGKDPSFAKVLFKQQGYLINPTLDYRIADNQGRTPVHIAAMNPKTEILQSFLHPGTYFMSGHNLQDNMGLTPLHYAVSLKNHQHIRLLLAAGASKILGAYPEKVKAIFPELNDNLTQLSPLWTALELNDLEAASLLVANASHLWNTKNSQGHNAVQMAAMQGRLDLLKEWDSQFVTSDILYSRDEKGLRLVHYAAMGGQLDVIKYLVSKNERLTRIDQHWNTALHFAAQKGHLQVVDYLLAEAKAEKKHNASLNSKEGWLKEIIEKKRILIEIDSENDFGETPYVLAQINGHEEVAKALAVAGAKKVSLIDHVIAAIDRSEKDVQRSEYKAAGVASKYHSMASKTDENGDTLLHRAIKKVHYRMLMVLFHPLKNEERKAIIQSKDAEGHTALELIAELRKKSLDKKVLAQLDKMERALIWYDDASFQHTYATVAQKAKYRIDCGKDFKEELEKSRTYSYYTMASIYGGPILAGLQMVGTTYNPFSFLFAAGGALLGGDVIENAERSLSLISQKFPDFLPVAVNAGTTVLRGVGFFRNTTKRVAVEIAKHSSAWILSEANFERYNSEIKNYLHYIDFLAVPHAVSEEFGRNVVATHLKNAFGGYDSVETYFVENYGAPRLNALALSAGAVVNEAIKSKTGVDLKKTVRNGYGWLEENVGSIPSMGAVLLKRLDSEVLDKLELDHPRKAIVKEIYTAGIELYRHDPFRLEALQLALNNYIANGQQTEHFTTIIADIGQSLQDNNLESAVMLADFFLAAPFYKSEHLTDHDRAELKAQLTTDIQAKQGFSEILSKVSTAGVALVAKNCVASLTVTNPTAKGYIDEGLRGLYAKWLNEPETFNANWSHLQCFLNYGVLSSSAAASLDHLANTQVLNGKDYTEVVTALTFGNQHYLKFKMEPQLLASFEAHFRESMKGVVAASPEEKVGKLHEMLASERQYSVDTYVKSLKGGQETANNFKGILHNNKKKYSADGLSEYAAQILVFNSSYYFGHLSQQQKLEMQTFFRAFFNHVQGNGTKFNEQAVVDNYNRALTFITCGSYMDFILSGAAVGGNVAAVFANLNSNEVRAAVAAHEVTTMVAESNGYSPLTFQQSFNLYRSFFDQQFASSTDKVEAGFRNIVNETLRKQDQTGGHYGLVLGSKTLDQAADFVLQSSRQIGENRWAGTGDAYARSIDTHSEGHTHRLFSSLERNVRIGFKNVDTTVSVGLQTNGQSLTSTITHEQSGSQIALTNPLAAKAIHFSLPPKVPTQSTGSGTTVVPVSGIGKTLLPIGLIPVNQTSIYTPLLAANDVRLSIPKDNPAPNVMRPKVDPAPLVIPGFGVGKVVKPLKLVPELPDSLLRLPPSDEPVTPPVGRTVGDRLLNLMGIGSAQANPVVVPLVGAAVATGAMAMAAMPRDPIASLKQTLDDFATEHPAVVTAANSVRTGLYLTAFPGLASNDSFGLFKKPKPNDKPRPNAPDPDKSYVPAPKSLPGFPDAKISKGATPYPGGIRKRWKTPDKKILEWDYQHGEVELYDKHGKHLGAYDPSNGEMIKPPKDSRNIKKYL